MSHQFGVGMVAVVTSSQRASETVMAALETLSGVRLRLCNGVLVGSWGLDDRLPSAESPLLLTTTNHGEHGRVEPATLARWLDAGDTVRLARMLPPFGALGLTRNGLRLSFDQLAFCPAYRCRGEGWSAVSTSALLLGRLLGRGLDTEGVLLQSQLGWQVGELTLFDGVLAVPPRVSIRLDGDGMHLDQVPLPCDEPGTISLEDGVSEAASGLRSLLESYLDQTVDPTLQLTGGQDSRIVLSAVEPARRVGLKSMTLDTPGTHDARIAAELSAHCGLRHTVHGLQGAERVAPQEWYSRVTAIARAQGCMTDPVARAVTAFAEESFEQGPRLSGLGGEVARGFFYHGPIVPTPVTRRRTELVARWRMLANDAVDPLALAPEYREIAVGVAIDAIHAVLLAAGDEWFSATDRLYEGRVQRWGGPGETSVSFQRSLTNPMLAPGFVSVARRLSPKVKNGALFLGRLQVALDRELAALPLDSRPSPATYAYPGLRSLLQIRKNQVRRFFRKAAQRARRAHKPPLGGAVVAVGLTEFLRREPDVLVPARASGVFDEAYLDRMLSGETAPTPATLALLTNVLVASSGEVTPWGGSTGSTR